MFTEYSNDAIKGKQRIYAYTTPFMKLPLDFPGIRQTVFRECPQRICLRLNFHTHQSQGRCGWQFAERFCGLGGGGLSALCGSMAPHQHAGSERGAPLSRSLLLIFTHKNLHQLLHYSFLLLVSIASRIHEHWCAISVINH